MRGGVAAAAGCLGLLLCGRDASAHRIDEYLQATIVSLQANQAQASMRLIPGMLVASSVIAEIDRNGDGVFSDDEERAYGERVLADLSIAVDGKSVPPKLVSWGFPQPAEMRAGLGEIHLEYTVELPRVGGARSLIVANHHRNANSVYLMNAVVPEDHDLRVLAQKRNEQQTVYEVDFEEAAAAGEVSSGGLGSEVRVWMQGVPFSRLFHLGMRHIAEGTDHLLFLLTLLLPAPLLAMHGRWGAPRGVRESLLRILGIVTAFTVGHSVTLTLAAMGFVHVPGRPIEALIAVSIFVSAMHALRPILPGKEMLIAGFFGLIHGLAFAATLDRLGLGRWERVAGILAFNLGIEAMQMVVVALILPSLLLMSRTRAYGWLRVGGAVFAGVASLGWMVERIFNVPMPVDGVVDALARHAIWSAAGLFGLSVVCRFVPGWSVASDALRGEVRESLA